jgi:hypothetical protein
MPDILRVEFKTYNDTGILSEQIERNDLSQSDPRPLADIQLIELASHYFQLRSHCAITAFSRSPHFVQLTTKNNVLRNADPDGGQSQNSYGPGGAGGTPRSSIGGAFMILVGATIVAMALKLTDAPRNPIWLLWIAGGIWLIAAFFVCQGMVLVLTGQWLI